MFDPTPIYDLLATKLLDNQTDSTDTARPATPSGEASAGHQSVPHPPLGRHAKQDGSPP